MYSGLGVSGPEPQAEDPTLNLVWSESKLGGSQATQYTPRFSPDGSCLTPRLICAMCHLVPMLVPVSWASIPEQTMAGTIAPPAPFTTPP